jgi:hypothetical protein
MYNNEEPFWHCKKCNKKIANCIDMDYHDNKEHPNFNDIYVKSWYMKGKPGMSPYD